MNAGEECGQFSVRAELNLQNSITAAIQELVFSFHAICWNLNGIKKMAQKIRKLLTCDRTHNAKADVDRLCLSRSKGGKGNGATYYYLENHNNSINIATEEQMLKLVKKHKDQRKFCSYERGKI